MGDVLGIVISLVAVITLVAALYFVVTALRDRRARRREEELAARVRAGQQRPRRTDGRGAHMR